ncbi:MAG: hypothetical protein A2939_02465 [Parcubacteria group bacterium RIFCSPLOWO2_01_FULL_48_18]|nr:MAG: hypothetical protein A2939_02465 [Parcubacteria group bacterium RIFCSPLOWO2_01_FULL_48_18]OHB24093.1 MAG: hypothetical protein A3J67_01390 [Parcubacteria group bacterium RIFCSPHIGHO2_02_FULL_48_10b]
MAPQEQQKKGGGKKEQRQKKTNKTTGKRKPRIQRHFDRLPRKKLLHVLKNSGVAAAKEYSEKHGLGTWAFKLIDESRWKEREQATCQRAEQRRQRNTLRRQAVKAAVVPTVALEPSTPDSE